MTLHYNRVTLSINFSEVFQVLTVSLTEVVIFGFHRQPFTLKKWQLSVREDPAGVLDRFPRFRPETESKVCWF